MTRFALDDRLPIAEWQRRRRLRPEGPMEEGQRALPALLADDQPIHQWMRNHDQQARGLASTRWDGAAGSMVSVSRAQPPTEVDPVIVRGRKPSHTQPPQPHRAPLTGRPGAAALVADALNTIASGSNTSAPIPVPAGTVSRGPGNDIHALGKVFGQTVRADATLDPPTGRAEISASGVKGGKGVQLPDRVRVFTTPTGELDVELPGPIKLGPVTIRPQGTYVIGAPDPPKPKSKSSK